MYIRRLTIQDTDVPSLYTLTISLFNPDGPEIPDTALTIFKINNVELDVEDIGTEEAPRRKVTWIFYHEEPGMPYSYLSLEVTEESNLGYVVLDTQWAKAGAAFIINEGSNVVQIISETYSSIKTELDELRAQEPISTPPIQTGSLSGGGQCVTTRGRSFYPI
jgi:hypothetical protein